MMSAIHRTKKITTISTIKKDKNGNQCLFVLMECCKCNATSDENFIAAATPIKIAKNENTATTKPLLMPFTIAIASRIKKITSIIIYISREALNVNSTDQII